MSKKRTMLTHAAKGFAYGDTSNSSVRNILTELSKSLKGGITEQEMCDTVEEEFNWECPYTGRNLRKSYEDADGTYATDHIYPQNREWCGLNVKGNLVLVDRDANNAKKGKDIETFMLEDSDFWTKLGVDKATRQVRLDKIKAFQRKCGYDPEAIRKVISPLLNSRYDDVRKEQEKCLEDALNSLANVGIYPDIIKTSYMSAVSVTSATPSATITSKKRSTMPELVFVPADESQFKEELLKTKKAHFVLTYASGHKKVSTWKAENFEASSGLKGNIQSRPFWRKKDSEGLVKVEVIIDYK